MRAEVKLVGLKWIDGQALAPLLAIIIVAAELEGQIDTVESAALVPGNENRAVDGDPRLDIHARGEIEPVRVGRIEGNALDSHQAPVRIRAIEPIGQRNPQRGCHAPTIGSAHVGADVHQPRLGGMSVNARHHAAVDDLDALPVVGR